MPLNGDNTSCRQVAGESAGALLCNSGAPAGQLCASSSLWVWPGLLCVSLSAFLFWFLFHQWPLASHLFCFEVLPEIVLFLYSPSLALAYFSASPSAWLWPLFWILFQEDWLGLSPQVPSQGRMSVWFWSESNSSAFSWLWEDGACIIWENKIPSCLLLAFLSWETGDP